LPQDGDELFAALLAASQDELVRLLALCVAATVDVVTPRVTPHPLGEALADAVGLDMAAWWQPTAEGYFRHVPKAVVLAAVGEYAPDHVARLSKLKKADLASEAERLVVGTGWMPAVFGRGASSQGAQQRERRDCGSCRAIVAATDGVHVKGAAEGVGETRVIVGKGRAVGVQLPAQHEG
jgi:ParB family chromosome partitioning protein